MGYEESGYRDGVYQSLLPPIPLPTDPYLDLTSFVFHQHQVWERTALVDVVTGKGVTYAELKRLVYTVAAGLAQIGLKQGDVLMMCMPNSIHFPVVCFAAMSLGAVVTTVNPVNSIQEITRQAKDSNSAFLATVPELWKKLASLNLPLVLVDGSNAGREIRPLARMSDLVRAEGKAPRVTIRQTDTAVLLYSSGTTGASKGVILSHGNLIASTTMQEAGITPNADPDVHCVIVPFFHVMGLSVVMVQLLHRGHELIVFPRYDFQEFLAAIERYRITYLALVPPIMVAIAKSPLVLKYDLSSVKAIGFGAAPSGTDVLMAVAERLKGVSLRQGYGMTETSGSASTVRPEDEAYTVQHGSCGMLSSNMEAKVVDVSTGQPLPPNQQGELWLRGPCVMSGYLNNDKATAETLNGEGWLHTGDLAYFDDHGFMYIVDRLKELIKYNGFQVAPAELESVLLGHPEIVDAAVVPFPEESVGEIPVAFVVRRPNSSLQADAVMKFVADQVSPYKKVRRVIFVDSIPKLASGKILRRELKKLLTPASRL